MLDTQSFRNFLTNSAVTQIFGFLKSNTAQKHNLLVS